MERRGGFTLIEVLAAVTMVVLLSTWAVPTFRTLRLDAERTRQVNRFLQAVHFARGEAMKRNSIVSLCPSADSAYCSSGGATWDVGWIAFANANGGAPAVRDPDEPLLLGASPWPGGRIIANRSTLSFRPFGQSGTTATFVFCDDRGSRGARAVIISQTGRPRVASRDSAGADLRCD